MYLQRSVPIQPKTSEICRNFAKKNGNYPTPWLGGGVCPGGVRLEGSVRGLHLCLHELNLSHCLPRPSEVTIVALLGRANLTGLVLGCIEAKCYKKICV